MLYLFLQPQRLGDAFWQTALPALSAGRRQKALRLRRASDRTLSAVAYLLLRWGLYREYGVEGIPACAEGPPGKPRLINTPAFFSLSHCPQAVACAVAAEEIGVDVDAWDAFSPSALEVGMLRRSFLPHEQEAILAASQPEHTACRLWTAKESVCKYTGQGMDAAFPAALRRTDVQIDAYPLDAHRLSLAVCRRREKQRPPLPWQEITPHMLYNMLETWGKNER